ncbi:MAG: ParB N-terminal domain-containing protein [Clostridia bacterium]|nr:ParB N-terminal domain-containing protein [Clostridia bacterium]
MNIQKIRIEKLKIAKYNSRKELTEKDKEYQKIKNSIQEFGYVEPIIVNSDMTVIGGHQRLKILKDLGYKEIECNVVELNKNKEKLLNIALNKISGEWDYQKLELLLEELLKDNIDLTITGFDEKEIDKLLKETEEIINNNQEINISEFDDNKFQCKCPKCGFMFDIKK